MRSVPRARDTAGHWRTTPVRRRRGPGRTSPGLRVTLRASRKGLGHPPGEWTGVVHHADELRGKPEHALAALHLMLRHEYERFAVTPSHRHRMVLSLRKQVGGMFTQVRRAAGRGVAGCRGDLDIVRGNALGRLSCRSAHGSPTEPSADSPPTIGVGRSTIISWHRLMLAKAPPSGKPVLQFGWRNRQLPPFPNAIRHPEWQPTPPLVRRCPGTEQLPAHARS